MIECAFKWVNPNFAITYYQWYNWVLMRGDNLTLVSKKTIAALLINSTVLVFLKFRVFLDLLPKVLSVFMAYNAKLNVYF